MTIKTILFYSSVGLQLLSDFRIQPRVFVLHIILLNVCFLTFRTVLHVGLGDHSDRTCADLNEDQLLLLGENILHLTAQQ